jgi:hypothetical protein
MAGPRDKFIHGSHNFTCDRCGVKKKASEKRKDGYNKGLVVCVDCWDRKPPSEDPIKIGIDQKPIRDARPAPADVYVLGGYDWEDAPFYWADEFNNCNWEDV